MAVGAGGDGEGRVSWGFGVVDCAVGRLCCAVVVSVFDGPVGVVDGALFGCVVGVVVFGFGGEQVVVGCVFAADDRGSEGVVVAGAGVDVAGCG